MGVAPQQAQILLATHQIEFNMDAVATRHGQPRWTRGMTDVFVGMLLKWKKGSLGDFVGMFFIQYSLYLRNTYLLWVSKQRGL